MSHSVLCAGGEAESSWVVRERVVRARAFRTARLSEFEAKGEPRPMPAATPWLLEARNRLEADAKALMREALLRYDLGGRGYVRTIELARTIADLDNRLEVGADDVAEALALRLDYRRIGFG